MPPRPEYWTLKKQQFDKIKSSLNILSEKLFAQLIEEDFQKIESSKDWLGFTVNRKKEGFLTLVSLSLIRELPIEFEIAIKECEIKDPAKTRFDYYSKTFSSLEEIEATIDKETYIMIQLLKTINQKTKHILPFQMNRKYNHP
jgi:hypothetical protein